MKYLHCHEDGIEHRLTKPDHPRTNRPVERMNWLRKDATVERTYFQSHEQLRGHLMAFSATYNLAKRLKLQRGQMPHEDGWRREPA